MANFGEFMDVSKRIYSICEYLKGSVLADIGTDHCYLPIFAIKSGKIKSAIGVDVNEGPLKAAYENIVRRDLEHKIQLRLGDGFYPIKPGECDTAVVSGMGGMLISNILENGLEIARGLGQLILSPQSDFALLRKSLHRFGFKIYDEGMVKDGAKFYQIILACPGLEPDYSESEYEFGRIMLRNPNDDFREFLEELRLKNENIIKNNPLSPQRKAELLDVNQFIKSFK